MRLIKAKDFEDMSRIAANIIAAQIVLKPDCVLGLATGSSPVGIYKNLVEKYEKGNISFAEVTSVNLDEYKGLDHDNDQSYYYFMNQHLFSKVDIDPANTHVPDGLREDVEEACKEYDEIIAATGGVDIQLLGIGRNGHIGFNEPSDHFELGTHCVKLTEDTINANKRFFAKEEDVPRYAFSMGIGNIMRAKKVLLIASGEDKAWAVKNMIEGTVNTQVQGSVLQLHQDVVVVADEAARSMLEA